MRWVPYAWWSSVYSTAFHVWYTDELGRLGQARCWTSTLGPNRVNWVAEDTTYLMKDLGWFGQLVLTGIALFLLRFGMRAMLRGELIVPATYGYHQPVHVQGWPLALLCLAAMCGAISLLAQVAFQHERRDRERPYTLLARGSGALGWILLWASLTVFACLTIRSACLEK